MVMSPGLNHITAAGLLENLRKQGHDMRIDCDPVARTVHYVVIRSDGLELEETIGADDLGHQKRVGSQIREHPISLLVTVAVHRGCEWSVQQDELIVHREKLARRRAAEAARDSARAAERAKWR